MGSLIELSAKVGHVPAARHFKLATVESCLSVKLLRYLARTAGISVGNYRYLCSAL